MGATNLETIVSAKTKENAIKKLNSIIKKSKKELGKDDTSYSGTWASKNANDFKFVSNPYYPDKKVTPKRQNEISEKLLNDTEKYGPLHVTQISATKFLAVGWTPE